jgi:uncharacterized protein
MRIVHASLRRVQGGFRTLAAGGVRILRPRTRLRAVMAAALAVVVVALAGIGLTRIRVDTSVDSFLSGSDPTMQAINTDASSFGGDPIVVILQSPQPDQLLIAPQQLQRLFILEGKLSKLPGVKVVYGPASVLNQLAISAQDVLAQIGGRRYALQEEAESAARAKGESKAQIQAAGTAAVAGIDARYGTLLAQGLPVGLPTLYNTNFVRDVIYQSTGVPRPQWHFVVPSADTVSVLVRPRQGLDQAGTERLVDRVRHTVTSARLDTARVTVTGVPVVTAAFTTEVTHEFPLLAGLAVAGCALVLLLVPWLRSRRFQVWPLAITAVSSAIVLSGFGWLGIPVSLGVIALLPILLGIGSDFPLYLAQRAQRRSVVVAGVASAAGGMSLGISPIPLVRELGVALAAGVLLVLALGVVLARWMPAAMEPPVSRKAGRSPLRRSIRVSALIGLIGCAGLGWGVLSGLPVEANPEQLAQGLPALTDANYAQQVLGSSVEVSVLIRGQDVLSPAALTWARQAEDTIILGYGNEVHPVLAAPDLLGFLGSSPTAAQITDAMQLLPPYLTSAVVTADGTKEVIVFGANLGNIRAQRAMLDGIRTALPPPPPGITAEVTGLPVAAVRAYNLISSGRYLTNLAGIALAGLVLLVGLRRRSDAFRAVLAGLLATGWGLAILWAAGGSLSPLTVTLGSLTTVTGCEFTIVLADARRNGQPWLRCGVAVACLTSCVGYLALVASGLAALREFGLLLAASVALSYLAAVMVSWLLPSGAAAGSGDVEHLDQVCPKEIAV